MLILILIFVGIMLLQTIIVAIYIKTLPNRYEVSKKISDKYDFFYDNIHIIRHDYPYIRYYKTEENCEPTDYIYLCNYNIVLLHKDKLIVYEIPYLYNSEEKVNIVFEYLRKKCLEEYKNFFYIEYNYDHRLKMVSKCDNKDIITLDFYDFIR